MKPFFSILISAILIVGLFTLFRVGGIKTPAVPQSSWTSVPSTQYASIPDESKTVSSNVTLKDGIQYITIDVRGGYSPRKTTAKWGIPTKLIARTNGTYDCSSALVIRAFKYQKFLPATADTEIDLATPASSATIDGVCSMGMYSFEIAFL